MKRIKAIVGLLLLMAGQAVAQEEHLVMHFDFENVDGKNVTDPVSGITAKVMNQASVVEMGSRRVLDLGNGTGYLDMTRGAGEVVRNLTDFTVSVYYRVDNKASLSGAGYFLWCFSQSAAPECPAHGHLDGRLGQRGWYGNGQRISERPLDAHALPSERAEGRTVSRR